MKEKEKGISFPIRSYILITQWKGASMDDQSKIPMTPFDTLISTPGLRMMKLMIPYQPAYARSLCEVYGITTDVFFFSEFSLRFT